MRGLKGATAFREHFSRSIFAIFSTCAGQCPLPPGGMPSPGRHAAPSPLPLGPDDFDGPLADLPSPPPPLPSLEHFAFVSTRMRCSCCSRHLCELTAHMFFIYMHGALCPMFHAQPPAGCDGVWVQVRIPSGRYVYLGLLMTGEFVCASLCSYKRVKGRSHTVEKRISMLPHKPHATSQPSRFSHMPRLSTDSAHNQHSH